ncbi:hypothetical protein C8F04DRAFT_1110204 [Mycena alexandri]|uniref:Microbial-type PARG catalytic domain-containing protein n=1 Tax=Mycena alexandri TaxID=1745969 RepID=A0AAD6X044_9AGAR|nr:hypothetical protein C8F04DRAFT_1110204 [Mycena alexandri]
MSTKTERSQLARKTINQHIPEVLQASSRARTGVRSSKVLRDLKPASHSKATAHAPVPPKISVVEGDTLEVAYPMCIDGGSSVAVLSMASELRPGGGFLSGANSQEESLCMRTTLYASLQEGFYRLPELGCVYTEDVCVFRGTYGNTSRTAIPSTNVNPTAEWWFVDVISCAAVRGPDVDEHENYTDAAQRDLMREKVKCIFCAAVGQGCRRLVLGAFGCGAFGNPPTEVAQLFRRVLLGRDGSGVGNKGGEFVGCFDEVTFAIKGGRRDTLPAFKAAFPCD